MLFAQVESLARVCSARESEEEGDWGASPRELAAVAALFDARATQVELAQLCAAALRSAGVRCRLVAALEPVALSQAKRPELEFSVWVFESV